MTQQTTRVPEGVIPPVVTPLNPDGTVDGAALRNLITTLVDAGVPGLFLAGTVGLGSILTTAQWREVVETALAAAPSGYPLLFGVLEPSTARAVERIGMLENAGAAAFVTVAPYYCAVRSPEALLRHFGNCRNAAAMEMVVYNIPACTGVEIPVETVVEMARRGWTSCCKDSSGNHGYFTELCSRGRECGLRVYQGMEPVFADLANLGAAGCVPVPANVEPKLYVEAWERRHQTDSSELEQLQKRSAELWRELVGDTDFLSGTVKRLAAQGIGSGTMPVPLGEEAQPSA